MPDKNYENWLKDDHYECYECCDTFPETTEIETCPLCGSHHVSERQDEITEEI